MNEATQQMCLHLLQHTYNGDARITRQRRDWYIVRLGKYPLGVGSTELGALRHACDRTVKFGVIYWRELAAKLEPAHAN